MAISEEDLKVHARIRRERKMRAESEGYDFHTRVVHASTVYKRSYKYRPQTADEWEELEF